MLLAIGTGSFFAPFLTKWNGTWAVLFRVRSCFSVHLTPMSPRGVIGSPQKALISLAPRVDSGRPANPNPSHGWVVLQL